MDFQFSEEQQLLGDSLSRLLQDQCGFEQRRAVAASEAGRDPRLWAQIAELGVAALGIPEAFGGLGGGATDRLTAGQAFGRALLLEPYMAHVLCSTAVQHAGTRAQQDSLLPQLASGELLLAWAHDETAGRHAPLWVQTQARREGDAWRLTGQKSLVLHAASAKHFIVTARVSGQGAEEEGLALFLVDAGANGATLRNFKLMDDTPAGELTLVDAPAQPLGLAEEGAKALAAIRATLAAGTAAACVDMLGSMEAAFDLTRDYVNTRKQFGKLIGEYQALRHRVAEMRVNLELARSMAMAAAAAVDGPASRTAATDLPRAKLVIGRHGRALAHAAIQSHGGIGMTEEYAVGHCLRRIHVMDHLFGDADAQAARLAKMLG